MHETPSHSIDRQLRYFVALAEELSVTRAAERLDLSQPALSQQLSGLEERLGHKLFDRTGRGLALTPIGARLAETVALGFGAVDQAIASIRDTTGVNERVSIASVHSLAGIFIPAAARATRKSHSNLRLSLDCAGGPEVIEKVLRNHADIGLVHGTLVGNSDLEVIPLLADPLAFAFSRDLPEATQIEASGNLVASTPIIAFPAGYALRRLADRFFAKRPSSIVAEVNSLDAMLALCSAGIGVCLLPRTLIHYRLDAATLVEKVPSETEDLQTAAVLIRLRTRPNLPAVGTFISSILRTAANITEV